MTNHFLTNSMINFLLNLNPFILVFYILVIGLAFYVSFFDNSN